MDILQIEGLTKRFGGLTAVSNFGFRLTEGELIGLIGPNGAGKTTVFNLITGVLRPDAGRIIFRGQNLAGRPPHEISTKGLVRTFQNIRLMAGLTVKDNLKPAFHHELTYSLIDSMFHTPAFVKHESWLESKIEEILDTLGLSEYAEANVSDLPYGIQRKVEIARALCMDPVMLLLDEPTAGLNPKEVTDILQIIDYLWKQLGIGLVVIEHNMRVIMSICTKIVVMDQGRVIAEGKPSDIQNNDEVIRVYLGERATSTKTPGAR